MSHNPFQGRNEYIGRTEAKPVVCLKMDTPRPHLDWYSILRYNKKAGDLLAAFELLLVGGEQVRTCIHVCVSQSLCRHGAGTHIHTYGPYIQYHSKQAIRL